MAHKRTFHRVDDAASLKVLASPARQELVDTLEGLGGEAAVAELAVQLGKPADGLYYHLNQLVRAGLLVEVPDRGDGSGRRYRSVAGKGVRVQLRYKPGDARQAAPLKRVVAGLVRNAVRDFDAALADAGVVAEGPRRELWASRTKGWVGPDELAEINTLLLRLGALLHKRRDARRARLVSLAWVLAPVSEKPVRRTSAAD